MTPGFWNLEASATGRGEVGSHFYSLSLVEHGVFHQEQLSDFGSASDSGRLLQRRLPVLSTALAVSNEAY